MTGLVFAYAATVVKRLDAVVDRVALTHAAARAGVADVLGDPVVQRGVASLRRLLQPVDDRVDLVLRMASSQRRSAVR